MNTLKRYYKEEIKKNAATIKFVKPRKRQLESLCSRGLENSEEAKKLRSEINNVWLDNLRKETRHLYLAYAIIQNKDPKKVESNYPEGHDKRILDRVIKNMAVSYSETFSVSDTIDNLLSILNIKEWVLCSFLEITEQTLLSFRSKKNLKDLDGIGQRLVSLNRMVVLAQIENVPNNEILNLLDRPFDPNREDSSCLLIEIIDKESSPNKLDALLDRQIKELKKEDLA